MTQTLRISDLDANGILIGLPRLLDALEPEGSRLHWAMFDLWITGVLGQGTSILDLEKKSREAPKGVRLTWAELRSLAEQITQLIDGVVVGCADEHSIPDRGDAPLFPQCDVVLEAIDSSSWEVTTEDEALVARLRCIFPFATLC